jgi:hypothetical protein
MICVASLRHCAAIINVQQASSVPLPTKLVVTQLAQMINAARQRAPVPVTHAVPVWSSLRQERQPVEQLHAMTCNAARMRPIAVSVIALQDLSSLLQERVAVQPLVPVISVVNLRPGALITNAVLAWCLFHHKVASTLRAQTLNVARRKQLVRLSIVARAL